MAFKMKGSQFYGKGNQSPIKQLSPEYMQSEEMETLFKGGYDADASKWEPTKPGEIRGLGTYVRNIETGEVKGTGMGYSKKKKGTSKKVGPAESPEMLAKKEKLAKEETKGPSGTIFDASDADYEKDKQERKDYREAKDYVKKK
tara:strand:- start:671 stop:1102 length:432 start_codon:yes stop_codon:yes gene_type:complete